ncbi:MAG: segregation/condensation protein A [Clostridiales bacterium]|nr:segregation/condensation protein A [Clostridiales bacterium]MDE6617495.1 segregation/condensation protein A [Clostridiales bacterium]
MGKKDEVVEIAEEEESSKSFRVVLSDFDGPLDLLLHYVKIEKIDIEDIFISDITDQYLKAMEGIDELDMEEASDFIVVAATLLEIKSKRLLPKIEEPVLQQDEEDPEQELITRLKEYKLYKEAAEKMREQEILDMHFRAPDDTVGTPRLILKDMTTNGLMNALKKLFDKIGERQQLHKVKMIERDPFTVEEKIEFIRERFKIVEQCTFDELFDEDYTVGEVVTTFSALLDLVKGQEVGVRQEDVFTTITIIKRRPEDNAGD